MSTTSKDQNSSWPVMVVFLSVSMCTSPQTISGIGKTAWRCSIHLPSCVSCKFPVYAAHFQELRHVSCCFLWNSLMAFPCSLVSFQVFRQQSVCVFGHWGGDCLSERSRWAVFAIWESFAVICRICMRFLHSKTTGSFWDPQSSQTLVLGSASNPITKMVPVGGKLWCGSQNRVLIINTTTLEKEVGRMCAGVWGIKFCWC